MMSGHKKSLPDDTELFEMMDKLGMEPAGAPVPRFGDVLASAYHICKSCQSVEECRDWLIKTNGSRPPSAPEFCLNVDLLSEFMFEPTMRKDS